MKLDKLFNVVVLGGAALVSACSDEDDVASNAAQGGTAGNGGAGTSSSSSTTGAGGGTGPFEAGVQGGAAGAGGETPIDAGAKDDGRSAESGLACSPTPNPSDPCGCPCCWVANCINTDACCKAFKSLCTP